MFTEYGLFKNCSVILQNGEMILRDYPKYVTVKARV